MYNVQFDRLARRPIEQWQSSYPPMFSKTTWFPSSPLPTARHADTTHTESVWRKMPISIYTYRRHTTCRLEFPSSFHRNLTPRKMSSSWQRSHHPESPPLFHLLTKNEVKDINIVHPNIHSKTCSQHHLVFPNTHRLCKHVHLDDIYA